MVSRHRRDDETFLFCIDSNARVGSVISNSVGGAEPDEESRNGEFFRAFLPRTGMALPATFRGGGGTWQDRTGRWDRLHHVGVACDELSRAWRSIWMACWRSRSAKITIWLRSQCNGPFKGGRHLSPLTPLAQTLQIERNCGCQRFVISLSKSCVIRRLRRHNGLRRRWSAPLRSEGVRYLQRHVRNQVHLQGMTGSLRRRGRRFAFTARARVNRSTLLFALDLGGRGVCFDIPGLPEQFGTVPQPGGGDD